MGLTAVVARTLAAESISANVIAGYHHDHVFVPAERADDALELLAQLVSRVSVPLTCLKVIHWSNPSQRSIFFWQVFFVELLSQPAANQQKCAATLLEAANTELRDGVLLFLERHVKKMVAKQHPTVLKSLRGFVSVPWGPAAAAVMVSRGISSSSSPWVTSRIRL